jgi:uncharacterized protein involved in response to NO
MAGGSRWASLWARRGRIDAQQPRRAVVIACKRSLWSSSLGRIAKVIAGSMGLTGFAIACIAGLTVGNPTNLILMRSLVTMIACYLLGSIIGAVVEWVVSQHLAEYKAQNPIPEYQPRTEEVIEVDAVPEQVAQTAQAAQTDAAERNAA